MFKPIANAQSPCTTRSTSEDRSPEAAETVSSGSWRGRRLSRQAAPERDAESMRTSGVMDASSDRLLARRTIQTPDKAAQPAPADKILREVLVSKKLPLRLLLSEQFSGAKIISFDCVERGGFYYLEPGRTHQAYYLSEGREGRSFIDLPLKPGTGEPRYLLTPRLCDDFIGIEARKDCIRVRRDKVYSPYPKQDFLFMPDDRPGLLKVKNPSFTYRIFSEAACEGREVREKSEGYENVFWGQCERANFEVNTEWCFNCQSFIPPESVGILHVALCDTNICMNSGPFYDRSKLPPKFRFPWVT